MTNRAPLNDQAGREFWEGILNKRIGVTLVFEGRGRTVAAEKAGFWGQLHDSANRSFQGGVIGVGKVGSPD